jgi:hypothetical protein
LIGSEETVQLQNARPRAALVALGATTGDIVADRPVRVAICVLGNVLVLGFWVVLWVTAPRSMWAVPLVLGAAILFNGVLVFRFMFRIDYPAAAVAGSRIVFRIVAESPGQGPLRPGSSCPHFVEFDRDDIREVSGHDIEIVSPGPRRTRGYFVRLLLHPRAEAELWQALASSPLHLEPRFASFSWLIGLGQSGEVFFKWHDTFTPPLHEWLGRLSQKFRGVEPSVRKTSLDLTGFARMTDVEQKSAIRTLTALNYKLSGLLLVRYAKKMTVDQSIRFLQDAIEHPTPTDKLEIKP